MQVNGWRCGSGQGGWLSRCKPTYGGVGTSWMRMDRGWRRRWACVPGWEANAKRQTKTELPLQLLVMREAAPLCAHHCRQGGSNYGSETNFVSGQHAAPLTHTEVGHLPGMPTPYSFSTASESSFPGEKRTRFFAGTLSGLRSRGFRPLRAAIRRHWN